MKLLCASKHRLLGTKGSLLDNPKPLKVSGIVLSVANGHPLAMLAGIVQITNRLDKDCD